MAVMIEGEVGGGRRQIRIDDEIRAAANTEEFLRLREQQWQPVKLCSGRLIPAHKSGGPAGDYRPGRNRLLFRTAYYQ